MYGLGLRLARGELQSSLANSEYGICLVFVLSYSIPICSLHCHFNISNCIYRIDLYLPYEANELFGDRLTICKNMNVD